MTISEETRKLIVKTFDILKPYFQHSWEVMDIYEGNLQPYVLKNLKETLSPQAYEDACRRTAPINLLPKIVDKMATIYNDPPMRSVEGGTESDAELLKWYEENLCVNEKFSDLLDLYVATKSGAIQPYMNYTTRKPGLRAIQNDRFFVMSFDEQDPMRMTHFITFDCYAENKIIFYCYTDTDIAVFDEKGDLLTAMMAKLQNDGKNLYGQIPAVYANSSRYLLIPKPDTDLIPMVLLVPVIFTDMNYAAMYQCFSIVYAVDCDDEKMVRSPNAVWMFKSDVTSQKEPKVGTIKPEVDIDQVKNYVASQVSLWLSSKGIRPGAVGDVNVENAASAISKIVDESDTVEYRKACIEYFTKIEAEFWDLLLKKMHPQWVDTNQAENKAKFSPDAKVITKFASAAPLQRRKDLIEEKKLEVESKFTTRKRAIQELNPMLDEKQVDDLIEEIDEENDGGETTESDNQNTGIPGQETAPGAGQRGDGIYQDQE